MSRDPLQKLYDNPAVVHAMNVLNQHGITTAEQYDKLMRLGVEREVRELLSDVYLPEGVDIWITHSNRNLRGFTPREMLDVGETEPVLQEAKRVAGGAW